MRGWGITLIFLAIGSAILPLLGRQFILLMWVDMWGPEMGWVLRGGVAALGVVMAIFGGSRDA
jgi:hypothetical protein